MLAVRLLPGPPSGSVFGQRHHAMLKWPVRSSVAQSLRATRCTGWAAEKRYSMPLVGPRTTIGERARQRMPTAPNGTDASAAAGLGVVAGAGGGRVSERCGAGRRSGRHCLHVRRSGRCQRLSQRLSFLPAASRRHLLGVDPTLVSPAAKSITTEPIGHSCRDQTGHTGSRAPKLAGSAPRSRGV